MDVLLEDVINGTGGTVTEALVTLCVDRAAETTASVSLVTPGGTFPVTYAQSLNKGTYTVAQYAAFFWAYVPGGEYSVGVSTSVGTAAATVTAPGGIALNADCTTATWSYEGNLDWATVMCLHPIMGIRYQTPEGIDLDSPFTFPVTTYQAYSYPATFTATVASITTSTDFSGASAGSSIVAGQVLMAYTDRQ